MISNLKHLILFVLLISVHYGVCKQKFGSRGGGGGGRRTTPRTQTYHTTQPHREYHQTSSHNNSFYQPTHVYQTGNSNPPAPSAPIAPPPPVNQGIGFDRVNQQSNQPSIGFENVHNRLPPQNNQPNQNIGFNVPGGNGYQPQNTHTPLNSGYQPQNVAPPPVGGGYQPGNPNAHPPYNGGYNPQPGGGYQPGGQNFNPPLNGGGYQQPQFGGGHYPQPGYGGFPGGNQGSYYNPQFGAPNGPPPGIYQPVQQSGGGGLSSVLGYAGTFAGGYLIGRLTSGGQSSDNNQYTVNHYHNNPDGVPKQISVSNKSLVICSQNDTQNLCAPNTFPICLANGTIMCVTHAPYTVPCGSNSSMACVISVLPCANNDTSCNTTANLTTTVVYIPCISNVTVVKRGADSNPPLLDKDTKFCVTAIAKPKKIESGVGSLLNFMARLGEIPFLDFNSTSNAVNATVTNTTGTSVPNVTNNNVTNNLTLTGSPMTNTTEVMQVRTVQVGVENPTQIVHLNSTENATTSSNGTINDSNKIITTTENVPITTTIGIPIIKSP